MTDSIDNVVDLKKRARANGAAPVGAINDSALATLLGGELSEARAAEYLAAVHGARLRFCEALGGWLVYNGRYWTQDTAGEAVAMAVDCAKRLADAARTFDDNGKLKRTLNFAIGLESRRVIDNVLNIAGRNGNLGLIVGDANRFDADLRALNATNCTARALKGELTVRPHDRADLITKTASAAYSTDATCPRWKQFVREIFNDDDDLVAFVQRALGYSLTGLTSEQCFFMLYGLGNNGKSTFLRVVGDLFGDYAMVANMETFTSQRDGGGASPDLARLRGARFVSAVETREGASLNEAFIKTITGSDKIPARELYCNAFEFVPQFKLWLAVNHKPRIRGTDEAIWRRVRLIPFTRTFKGENCDPDLYEKLCAEFPGIFAWIVRGTQAWQRDGLGHAKAEHTATAEYRSDSDVLAQFIADKCVLGQERGALQNALYKAVVDWARENGERPPRSAQALREALVVRGCRVEHKRRGNVIFGITLADTEGVTM
jgi:putative DNA primase/helicase